jgi:5,10-methylene-tetrahydrofolate dehydrogenase/methenyl tetrahydrofolate cyclohydrolase
MAGVIDGDEVAARLRAGLTVEVLKLKAKGICPGLAVVLVGEDPASKVYVGMKEKACLEAGIYTREHKLPAMADQTELLALIGRLNRDPKIHGILLQFPLPDRFDADLVLKAVSPAKDVGGLKAAKRGESRQRQGADTDTSGRPTAAAPGGVDASTIARLLQNTVDAASRADRRDIR